MSEIRGELPRWAGLSIRNGVGHVPLLRDGLASVLVFRFPRRFPHPERESLILLYNPTFDQ